MVKKKDFAIFGDSNVKLNQFSSKLASLARIFPEFREIFSDEVGLATFPSELVELMPNLALIAKNKSEHFRFYVEYNAGFLVMKVKCGHLAVILAETEASITITWSTGSVEQEEIDSFVKRAITNGLDCHKELVNNYDADKWLAQ